MLSVALIVQACEESYLWRRHQHGRCCWGSVAEGTSWDVALRCYRCSWGRFSCRIPSRYYHICRSRRYPPPSPSSFSRRCSSTRRAGCRRYRDPSSPALPPPRPCADQDGLGRHTGLWWCPWIWHLPVPLWPPAACFQCTGRAISAPSCLASRRRRSRRRWTRSVRRCCTVWVSPAWRRWPCPGPTRRRSNAQTATEEACLLHESNTQSSESSPPVNAPLTTAACRLSKAPGDKHFPRRSRLRFTAATDATTAATGTAARYRKLPSCAERARSVRV